MTPEEARALVRGDVVAIDPPAPPPPRPFDPGWRMMQFEQHRRETRYYAIDSITNQGDDVLLDVRRLPREASIDDVPGLPCSLVRRVKSHEFRRLLLALRSEETAHLVPPPCTDYLRIVLAASSGVCAQDSASALVRYVPIIATPDNALEVAQGIAQECSTHGVCIQEDEGPRHYPPHRIQYIDIVLDGPPVTPAR
jgi:hypothetical protein